MTKRRVLVTGATGFIGAHALAPLRRRGFEIHTLGRSTPRHLVARHHPGDLFDREAVARAVEAAQATHLLHLAWSVEPGQYWRSARNLDWVAASLALARAFAASGGQRLIAAGTCAEYRWGDPVLHEHRTPCDPATLYGACKDALRRVLVPFGQSAGLSVGWGRVFYLFGPGEPPGRLVGDALRALRAGETFATTHGRQRRDFLHVADVAEAFAALLDSAAQGPVNIGSGAAVPVRQVIECLARRLGAEARVAFGARPLSPDEPDTIEAAVDRLRDEVGFRPRFGLAAGLADTAGTASLS